MHSIDVDRLHALERALHAQIPLTRAMDVRVLGFDRNGLTLGAALIPNLNHKLTELADLACSHIIVMNENYLSEVYKLMIKNKPSYLVFPPMKHLVISQFDYSSGQIVISW